MTRTYMPGVTIRHCVYSQ